MLTRRVTAILRHNTTMPGDADLARREWAAIMGNAGTALTDEEFAASYRHADAPLPRLATAFGYVAVTWMEAPLDRAAELIRCSAFAQEIFIEGDRRSEMLTVLNERIGSAATPADGFPLPTIVALAHNYVIETEAVLASTVSARRLATVIGTLLEPYRTGRETPLARKLRRAKKTTLSLSHDLHIYKAKFFPRMVRALINIYGRDAAIFDPYCGSGTALLEAALLGQDAIGVDIDPICEMMSRSKVTPFVDNRGDTRAALEQLRIDILRPGLSQTFRFPDELERKIIRRDRIDGTGHLGDVIRESAALADALSATATRGTAADLVRTLASDAVTKKIRYRFVGVGNGRYTIEILKQSLLARLQEKIDRALQLLEVFAELESELGIRLGRVTVVRGDARDSETWPRLPASTFVVTSPPYLPASSGREHYASSRALAFAILGFDAGKDGYFDRRISDGVAPVFASGSEAGRLMTYLLSDAKEGADPQRDAMRFERKAVPTAHYLADMSCFGAGLARASGASRMALVVADQHVFYSHRRGEIEHIVDCAALYGELLGGKELKLTDEIKLQLLKSAASRAKPRSKDDYHEAVLIFEPTRTAEFPPHRPQPGWDRRTEPADAGESGHAEPTAIEATAGTA